MRGIKVATHLSKARSESETTRSRRCCASTGLSSVVATAQHRQIESAEALGVGEDVDLDDLAAADRERHDRERLSVEHADEPRGAVDEHGEPEQAEAREALRSASHLLRAAELDRRA